MLIIDAHAHIYPEKVAEKATKAIGGFYGLPMEAERGSAETLLKNGRTAGVSKYIVHSVAMSVEKVSAINAFLLREIENHPEFVGFITLHPDMDAENVKREISWGIDNGFKGIKMHPDFQRFNADDKKMKHIYDAAAGKLPVLLHAGDIRYEFSRPERIARVAAEYPDLKIIAAHFGGYQRWDETDCYIGLKNVYFDTSSSLAIIGSAEAKRLINKLGAEKFFFGVDFPMWNTAKELERFMDIDLTAGERRKILSENIAGLLDI